MSLRKEIRKHLSDIYWFGYEKLGTEGEAIGDSVDAILEAIKKRVPKKKIQQNAGSETNHINYGYHQAIDDFTKELG